MARKVVAVWAALIVFLVVSGTIVRTALSLVLLPGVGKPEDLNALHPWLRWPLIVVTLALAAFVAGSASRKVLRWGFRARR